MDNQQRVEMLAGFLIVGAVVTGVCGLLGAVLATFQLNWVGAGACLIATAIAFTGLVNAVYRR
jgi:hypothetical protein